MLVTRTHSFTERIPAFDSSTLLATRHSNLSALSTIPHEFDPIEELCLVSVEFGLFLF